MRLRPFAVVVVTAALALSGCTAAGDSASGNLEDRIFVPAAERGDAPDLTGEDLAGEPLSLADFRGQVVVANVWGSWCAPCRKETPDLIASSKELARSGVRFVGINTADNAAAAKAYVRSSGIPYPSFYDPDGKLLLNLRDSIPPKAAPSTLVFDTEGRVAASVIGVVTQKSLSPIVGKVVLEAARASAATSTAASRSESAAR